MTIKRLPKDQIDLHLHSKSSDGQNTVNEVIDLAFTQGKLKVADITDHNYFSLTQKQVVGTDEDQLTVIPGCEFSTTYVLRSRNMYDEIHVIGIFPNGVDPKNFEDLFAPIEGGRKKYIGAILDSLHNLGVGISMEEVLRVKRSTGYLGRFQIATVLVEKGYGSSVDEIMDRFIGNFSPYYINPTKYIDYAPFQTVIERILANGGFPILCHPLSYHRLAVDEITALVQDFKEATKGVGGIEVYYSHYTEEQREYLRRLQEEAGLIPSVASDRHRVDQPFASYGGYSLYQKMLKALNSHSVLE